MAQHQKKSTARRQRVAAALSGTLEPGEHILAECRCQPPGAIQNQQQPVSVVLTDRRLFVLLLDAFSGRKVKEIVLSAPASEMRSVVHRRSHPIATFGIPLVSMQIAFSTGETLTFQASGVGNRGLEALAEVVEDRVAADAVAREAASRRGEPMPEPPVTAISSPAGDAPPTLPEPAKGRSRVYWLLTIAGSLAALAFVAWSASVFVGNQVERYHIDHAGILIQAKVVDHSRSDNGDGSGQDSLAVVIPACHCAVWVPTDNPGGHPSGSRIPVRYDPSDPTQVIVQVNEPSNWFDDLSSAFFLGWVALIAITLVGLGIAKLWGRQLEDTPLRMLWARVRRIFSRTSTDTDDAPTSPQSSLRVAPEATNPTPFGVSTETVGSPRPAEHGPSEWPAPAWVAADPEEVGEPPR